MKQISSNQRFFNHKIIFSSTTPMLSLKISFMRAKDVYRCIRCIRCKFAYLYSSFAYSMSDDTVYCIESATFLSLGNHISFGFLSARDKRIARTFHENQRLNIGNQYQKDATQFVPRIIEKFEEPHNIIPHHIDETVKERQKKYQKIVQALDKILYLIEKQGISHQETQKSAANIDTL